jgi:hypothetical protein
MVTIPPIKTMKLGMVYFCLPTLMAFGQATWSCSLKRGMFVEKTMEMGPIVRIVSINRKDLAKEHGDTTSNLLSGYHLKKYGHIYKYIWYMSTSEWGENSAGFFPSTLA